MRETIFWIETGSEKEGGEKISAAWLMMNTEALPPQVGTLGV